jgi:ABC-type dipeptide/oligopeptide/nickel transport system permease component
MLVIPTLLGGVTFVFLAINIIPGDPAALFLEDYYTGEAYEALKQRMGLDKPLHIRYVHYLGDLARGSLGRSFRTGRSVLGDIGAQFPYTFFLAVSGLVLAVVIGVSAGVISATTHNRWPDQIIMVLSLFAISTPSFVLATILILIFSIQLDALPAIGGGDLKQPLDMLKYLVLPAISIGSRSAALIARITRSALLETIHQDYVRTARAKGLRESWVVFVHAFRNAMIPVITVVALNLGSMLGGATVTETVFSRPGMGKLLVGAVLTRDYPQVQGTMIFYMAMILFANLLADLGYALADPRIRYD